MTEIPAGCTWSGWSACSATVCGVTGFRERSLISDNSSGECVPPPNHRNETEDCFIPGCPEEGSSVFATVIWSLVLITMLGCAAYVALTYLMPRLRRGSDQLTDPGRAAADAVAGAADGPVEVTATVAASAGGAAAAAGIPGKTSVAGTQAASSVKGWATDDGPARTGSRRPATTTSSNRMATIRSHLRAALSVGVEAMVSFVNGFYAMQRAGPLIDGDQQATTGSPGDGATTIPDTDTVGPNDDAGTILGKATSAPAAAVAAPSERQPGAVTSQAAKGRGTSDAVDVRASAVAGVVTSPVAAASAGGARPEEHVPSTQPKAVAEATPAVAARAKPAAPTSAAKPTSPAKAKTGGQPSKPTTRTGASRPKPPSSSKPVKQDISWHKDSVVIAIDGVAVPHAKSKVTPVYDASIPAELIAGSAAASAAVAERARSKAKRRAPVAHTSSDPSLDD